MVTDDYTQLILQAFCACRVYTEFQINSSGKVAKERRPLVTHWQPSNG